MNVDVEHWPVHICGIMRKTSGVIFFCFLTLFILFDISANVNCDKTPSSEELKAQKFPPCAACKILVNSFKKVR